MSLGDTVYEYGSIMSTQPSPNGGAASGLQGATDTDEDGEISHSRSMNATGQGVMGIEASDVAPSDLSILDVPETTFDLDEEFWRLNESLLGQQYLNSFFMGNDASVFGDDSSLDASNQPVAP